MVSSVNIKLAVCDLTFNFTQDVTNITFILETSPNKKPIEKKVGGQGMLCPPV